MKKLEDMNKREWEQLGGVKGYVVLLRAFWVDLVKLNLLFLLGCLLLISIPASVTAMSKIIGAMIRKEEYSLMTDFFSVWKRELLSSLAIGVFVAIGFAVGIFGVVVARDTGLSSIAASNITQAICILLCLASLNIGVYAFPMKARLHLPVVVILRNSLLLLIAKFKQNFLADIVAVIFTGLIILGIPFDLPLFFVGFFSFTALTLCYITRSGIDVCTY